MLREHKRPPIRISDFGLPDPKRDLDRHQNCITWSLSHALPIQKISSKSVLKFASNPTDRQTNRPHQKHNLRRKSAEVISEICRSFQLPVLWRSLWPVLPKMQNYVTHKVNYKNIFITRDFLLVFCYVPILYHFQDIVKHRHRLKLFYTDRYLAPTQRQIQ